MQRATWIAIAMLTMSYQSLRSSTTRSEPIYKNAREVSASQILLGLNINRSFFRTTLPVTPLIAQLLPFANLAFRKSLPSLLAGPQSDRGRLESAEMPHLPAPASSYKVCGTH